jgi:hypothetical protein
MDWNTEHFLKKSLIKEQGKLLTDVLKFLK